MSIIVALISEKDGIVASDGRLFGPAMFENDQVIQPAAIESDEFDKTFSLGEGRLIGAFSGLTHFSGKNIREHVEEVIVPLLHSTTSFEALSLELEKEFYSRFIQIDSHEVILPCRKLEMLLVAGNNLNRSEMRIRSIRFIPKGNEIVKESNIFAADKTRNRYVVGGDMQAGRAAMDVLGGRIAIEKDSAFLKKLAKQAIQAGIVATGAHPLGIDPACGGSIFVQRTWYPVAK